MSSWTFSSKCLTNQRYLWYSRIDGEYKDKKISAIGSDTDIGIVSICFYSYAFCPAYTVALLLSISTSGTLSQISL